MTVDKTYRINVLGVGVSAINLSRAAEILIDAARSQVRGYVTVTGVHGIVEAQDSRELKQIFNHSFLTTPDGMPMSWIGWMQGQSQMDRVYGPDLMLEIMRQTNGTGIRHFFFGGNVGVAEELKRAMEKRFPQVSICGTYTPPFRPLNEREKAALLAMWENQQPHLIWVGLSTPKQEYFMAEYVKLAPPAIFIGVGAAYDFHTGRVRQAPRWMQRASLEWFFRLTQEPRRLWKRYFFTNPRFLWLMLLQATGLRRFGP